MVNEWRLFPFLAFPIHPPGFTAKTRTAKLGANFEIVTVTAMEMATASDEFAGTIGEVICIQIQIVPLAK